MTNFSHGVSEDRVISQFSDFIHSSQFRPKTTLNINADGKIHRYALETDRGGATSGAYALHVDGCPAGFVMDWHNSENKLTWRYEYTDEERREYARAMNDSESRAKYARERREAERKKAEAERLQKENQQAALSMALREYLYADLFGVFQHQYLRSRFTDKGIRIEESTAFNIRDRQTPDEPKNYRPPADRMPLAISMGHVNGGICKPGELLIPMRNVLTGTFQSLIHVPVKPDKERGFLKLIYTNTSITGAAHELIPRFSEFADCLFVCEGITTAIALLVDLREKYPIFSAGSCGNLYPVCEGLRKRYPNKRIVLVADNDKNGVGINAANKCRNAGLVDGIRMPEISGHDWYDRLITRKGI